MPSYLKGFAVYLKSARARVEYGREARPAKGLHVAHDAKVAPVTVAVCQHVVAGKHAREAVHHITNAQLLAAAYIEHEVTLVVALLAAANEVVGAH